MSKHLSDGFDRIHAATCHAMARLAYGIARDEQLAEDACQEAYAALLVALRKGTPIANAAAWLRRVVVHKSLDALKARPRTVSVEAVGPVASADGSEQLDGYPELKRALDGLPPEQRQAVVLHALDGYTCREVADALDCSKSEAGRLIDAGLRALRRALAAELDGPAT